MPYPQWDPEKHPRGEAGRFAATPGERAAAQPGVMTRLTPEEKERRIKTIVERLKQDRLRNAPRPPLPKGKTEEEHIRIAQNVLTRHAENLDAEKTKLAQVAGDLGQVSGRTKDLGSALEKMGRKPYYETAEKLQDVTGLRVVTASIGDVREAIERIRRQYEVVSEDNYIDTPRGEHYRSHHLIVRGVAGDMEIQVRTERQHAVAQWGHNVYKPLNMAEKLAAASPTVQSYIKGVSTYFYAADLGRNPPPPHKPPCGAVIREVFGCL